MENSDNFQEFIIIDDLSAYGIDEEELEEAIGKILTEKNLTLAIAESCTGGLIANKITDVS